MYPLTVGLLVESLCTLGGCVSGGVFLILQEHLDSRLYHLSAMVIAWTHQRGLLDR